MDVEPVDVPHLLQPAHVFFFTVHRSSGRVARASSRASRTTALVSRSQRALTIPILWSSDSFVTFIRQLPDSGQRSTWYPTPRRFISRYQFSSTEGLEVKGS